MRTSPGPARLKLALELDKDSERADRASAHAALDLDAPQLKGTATITAKPEVAALRALDLDKLQRSDINVESKLSSEQGQRAAGACSGSIGIVAARRPDAVSGIGWRCVARAVAAESQPVGHGT